MLAWESFGEQWVTDVAQAAQAGRRARALTADYGRLPDLAQVDGARDVVFTWNGTTSGVVVPDGDWIAADREALALCDATSAVFAYDLPWDKLDVVTWSWQKVLGGEAQHGMLALSPARRRPAGELHAALADAEALPHDQGRQAGRGHLRRRDDQHAVDAGGRGRARRPALGRGHRRAAGADRPVERQPRGDRAAGWRGRPGSTSWPRIRATRSRTSVCLKIVDPWFQALPAERQASVAKRIASLLEQEGAGYDVGAYRDAPPGLRLWGGATVETADLEALFPWLDWAWASVEAELAAA